MNERIKELKIQACKWASENAVVTEYENAADQKFAELIVRECAGQLDWILAEGGGTQGDLIREHFGVEE
jgi:hypothetical protein